jgi:hypothetical protein
MFYGFAEAAGWRAFQHFDQIREPLENRRCNTSFWRHELVASMMFCAEQEALRGKSYSSCGVQPIGLM